MAECLTQAAKDAMALAEQHAQRLNHGFVGTEHVLLGLLDEPSGWAAGLLARLGVEAKRVRAEVEKLVAPGLAGQGGGAVVRTPRASKAVERGGEEARMLMQGRVGPEHLLLGLTLQTEGVAAVALVNLGVDLRELRQQAVAARLEQFKIVERAVRPVRASTVAKRKMREEMLAHLTGIYEQELARVGDSVAAMRAAAGRFGGPAVLARQLQSAVTMGQRVGYWLERRVGWRPPETGTQWSLRLAGQVFVLLSLFMGVAALQMWMSDGWSLKTWLELRQLAALWIAWPIVQAVAGILYFKMRDAIWGVFGSRQSRGRAVIFGLMIGVAVLAGGMMVIAVQAWNVERAVDSLGAVSLVALAAAGYFAWHAVRAGRAEISDTIWACLDIAGGESRALES